MKHLVHYFSLVFCVPFCWSIVLIVPMTTVAEGGVPLNAAATVAQIQASRASAQAHSGASNDNQIGKIMTDGRVTLLQLKNAQGVPSEVLRSFQANGKIYVINRNGIIFGSPRQIDTHALSSAAMKPVSNASVEEAKRLRGRKSDSVIEVTLISLGDKTP